MTLHEYETQEAFSEHEGKTQWTCSKLEEETQEALSEVKGETQEALSEHEQEQQQNEGEARLASGSANFEGPALPALRKLTTERGTSQLTFQELGLEQQLTLYEHETQEAFSEYEGETQGTFSKLEEETQEASSEVEEDSQEALTEHEREQQQKEREVVPPSGSANLEAPVLPALRKLTIDGNIPPILSSRTRSQRPHTGVEGVALHCFLSAVEAEEENGVQDALACDDEGQMAMKATLDIAEPRNRRQAMESPVWDEWRKAEKTEMLGIVENCVYKHVVRPKDNSWLAQKCSTREKSETTARSRSTSADLSHKGSGRWKVYTTRKRTPPYQRPRQSGCFWGWQRSRTESCAISTRSGHLLRRILTKKYTMRTPRSSSSFRG